MSQSSTNTYPQTIDNLISDATLIAFPYDSAEQTSSEVLVEAIAGGIPVVATGFPQVVELADHRAVAVVPHPDPEGLAEAAVALIEDPEHDRHMVTAQTAFAETTGGTDVRLEYLHLAKGKELNILVSV